MRNWFNLYRNAAVILLNTLLLLVLLNVGLHYFYRYLDSRAKQTNPVSLKYGPENIRKAYPNLNQDEIDELLTETWSRPQHFAPFTGFREAAYKGKYVNVHTAGFRQNSSENPWPLDTTRFNVFVFGGSTTFGYGVADNQTIPAYLQQFLEKQNPEVTIYNFGAGYFYSEQERILFEQLLLAGHKPDMAIFIDGLNDFFMKQPYYTAEMEALFRKQPSYLFGKWFETTPLKRLATSLNYRLLGVKPAGFAYQESCEPDTIKPLISRYLHNKGLTEVVGAAADVPVYFVWQPVSCYQYSPTENLFGQSFQNCYPGCVYQLMENYRNKLEAPGNTLWLADIARDTKKLMYVDKAHYNPDLSRLMASRIATFVQKKKAPEQNRQNRPKQALKGIN